MEGLTKEYFDEKLSTLTDDITDIKQTMSTKQYLDGRLDAQTNELKAYTDEKQAELAGMIERTINVTSRVDG